MEESNAGFSISKETADELYESAGQLVPEDSDQITMETHGYLFSDSVNLVIQQVLDEHPLPFKLMNFQLLTIHALGSLKNVILLAPTGAGKMICAYYGILVLQKIFKIEKGVGLGTLPVSALMEEKVKDGVVKTGLITMSGSIKASIEENEAVLSDSADHFKNGDISVILGHPEAWLTSTAEDIVQDLSKQALIVGTFLDEFQMNLCNHWGSDFRLVFE